MNSKLSKRYFFYCISAFLCILSFNNCGEIQTPGVMDGLTSVSFQHTGNETSCTTCHERMRPAPIADVVHGNGQDCIGCHNTSGWVNFSGFAHSPTPSSCTECHSGDRPIGLVGINSYDHSTAGTGDCVSCHATQAGVTWIGGVFSHTPTPTSCATCHSQKRPVGLIGTPPFDHGNGGSGDCVSCHTSPGVVWTGGSFNHTPTPTSCAGCHQAKQPVILTNKMAHKSSEVKQDCVTCHKQPGVVWSGTVYHANLTTQPTTCMDCHNQQRPVGLIGTPPFNHANGGSGDCGSCHKKPGVAWTGGNYNHSPTPTACIGCHLSKRPVGLTGTPPFNHANGGTGDCVSCHKNPGVAWTGGSYNHIPAPTSCAGCHQSREPVAIINKMKHSSTQVTQDCATCHKQPGVVWSGSRFHSSISAQPTSCLDCHSPQRPVGLIGTPPFDHANGGTGDCVTCHKRPGISWAGGLIAHSPTPTSCNQCHQVDRPATTKYPDSNATVSGHYTAKDCYACHMPKSASLTTFKFNHSNALNTNITFCLPCHLSKGQSEHRNDGNVTLTGDGNCYSCHNKARKSWRR